MVLRVADLRAKGIDVIATPLEDNPGHVELPQLTANNRDEPESVEIKDLLARLTIDVLGPFPPQILAVNP